MIATCPRCTWEVDFITEAEAERAKIRHGQARHGDPKIEQLPSVVGWAEALTAAREKAALGVDFMLSDLPDVEHHKTNKGRLATEIHRLGIAHPVGYARSKRKNTRGSAAKVWNESRARCIECPAVRGEAS